MIDSDDESLNELSNFNLNRNEKKNIESAIPCDEYSEDENSD
jgi:hypothetical protein